MTKKIPSEIKGMVYICYTVNIGYIYETTETLEYCHILEHLVAHFTSKKYPDFEKINEIFDKCGVKRGATTSTCRTNYYLSFPKRHSKLIMDIAHNAIYDFKMDTSIFENEKKSVVLELKRYLEDPMYPINYKTSKLLFPDMPFFFDFKKGIDSTKKATKKSINTFYKKNYTPDNIKLFILGDYTGKTDTDIPLPIRTISYDEKPIKHQIIKVKSPDTNVLVSFRLPFDRASKDYQILLAIKKIYFGGLTSPIYKRLRHKLGLIYSINFSISMTDTHKMNIISIETKCRAKKVNELISNLFDVMLNTPNNVLNKSVERFHELCDIAIISKNNCEISKDHLNFYIHNPQGFEYTKFFKSLKKIKIGEIKGFIKKYLTKDKSLIVHS